MDGKVINIEEAIELIQQLQALECSTYEKSLLDMAEAALVDLVNLNSDGPLSFNVAELIKTWKTK